MPLLRVGVLCQVSLDIGLLPLVGNNGLVETRNLQKDFERRIVDITQEQQLCNEVWA